MIDLTQLEAALAQKGTKVLLFETEGRNRIDMMYSNVNDTKEGIDQVIRDIYSNADINSRVDDGTYRCRIRLTLD